MGYYEKRHEHIYGLSIECGGWGHGKKSKAIACRSNCIFVESMQGIEVFEVMIVFSQ